MINVWIDDLTPCLKDNETGDFVQTEVVRIRRKSFLEKFNKKNGWYTDWVKLLQDHEVYALVVKGTVDIQGLVALNRNNDFQAVYIAWMCVAPQNNKMLCDYPKYTGVGGHLFAIAADKSMEYGFDGVIVGYAANEDLVKHYCEVFKAEHIAMLHPFQIAIYEKEAADIREVYDYEWTDEEI